MLKTFFLLISVTSSALAAKTDLAGCTLTIVPLLTEITTATDVNGAVLTVGNYEYTTFLWDGTEQCQLLDCGGGRAPPKNAPGCPLYTGTDTVPPLPFPTAPLTLAQTGATSVSIQASSAATPVSVPASTSPGPAPATSPSNTATSTLGPLLTAATIPSLTSTPTAATSDTVTTASVIQASDLNPTVTASPNGALGDDARWNMAFLGLAVVAVVAPYL